MMWSIKGGQLASKRCLALLGVLLWGMSTSVSAQMPEWVQISTPDTDTHMYGIGSGNSLQQAKNMALAELAGKISSQVQQLFQMQEQAVNDDFSSQIKIDTRVEVGATDLKYFYINQTEQLGSVYWVELVLDKTKMANDLKAQFEIDQGSLTTQMDTIFEQSKFMQMLQTNAASRLIVNLQQLLMQLKYFSPAFETKPYVEQYNQYLIALHEATAGNQVFLDDRGADPGVVKALRNWLSSNGINLAKQQTQQTDVIHLSTQVDTFTDKRDAHIAQIITTITVKSDGFGQIGHTTIKTKGRDYQRKAEALEKAVSALSLKIKRAAPAQLLNISVL